MKNWCVFGFVLLAVGLVSGAMDMTATDLGGGDFLIELIQDAENPIGSGGVFKIPVGGWSVSEMKVLPTMDFGEGQFWGWEWILAGIGVNADREVQITAVPGLGVGTPGIGSVIDPIFGVEEYTSTASFVLSPAVDAPPEGYRWEYSGPVFGLYGQWGQTVYDTEFIPFGNTPVLVPIPEPAAMALLGMGTLLMRRRKQTNL